MHLIAPWRDGFHAVPKAAAILLISGFTIWVAASCGRPGREITLSDRDFAGLVIEVMRLNARYAGQPDSLASHKAALFRARGVTREDLEGFIDARHTDPEAWAPVLAYLKEKLGEEAPKALGKDAVGKGREAKADSLKGGVR